MRVYEVGQRVTTREPTAQAVREVLLGSIGPVLVSFGDGRKRYRSAVHRLSAQAIRRGHFSTALSFSKGDLDAMEGVQKSDLALMQSNSPGFGFWIWKILIIDYVLRHSPDGALVAYIDAGCEFNPKPQPTFRTTYWPLACLQGVVAFDSHCLAVAYTKPDIWNEVGYQPKAAETQVAASVILFHGGAGAREFIDAWLSLARKDSFRLLDDSPPQTDIPPSYIASRYDQALLSALYRKAGLRLLEQPLYFGPGYWQWRRRGRESVVWASRNVTGIPRYAWPSSLSWLGWFRYIAEGLWGRMKRQVRNRSKWLAWA